MSKLDLTEKKPGCTGHPILRLNRFLKEAKKKANDIEIIFDKNETPIRAIQMILKKHNFKAIRIEEENNQIVRIVAKKSDS